MALSVVQYEEIVSLLLKVPSLVDLLERHRSDFCEEVLAWLRQIETTLENNRLPVVSEIASCRAILIGAGRGILTKEIAFTGRPTARKVQEATASMVLTRSNDLLYAVITERQAAFQDAERISRQILAVAEAKGLIRACDDGRPHQDFLHCLQKRVAVDPDLASIHAHLVALVGTTDVLIFFDRALALVSQAD
jgi:hypothetical protein